MAKSITPKEKVQPGAAQGDTTDGFLAVETHVRASPARLQVGETVLNGNGDEVRITMGYGLHAWSDGKTADMRWGYNIENAGKAFFARAGWLWRTDDIKPSWLRLATVDGKAVH